MLFIAKSGFHVDGVYMTPSSNPRGVTPFAAVFVLSTALLAGATASAEADWLGPVVIESWSETVVIMPPRPLPYPHRILVEPPEEVVLYDEEPMVDDAIIAPPDFGVEDEWARDVVLPRALKPRRDVEQASLPDEGGPRVVPSLAPKKPAKPRVVTVKAALTLPVPRPNLEGVDADWPLVPVAATGAPAGNR
jgi:hypothetical protein